MSNQDQNEGDALRLKAVQELTRAEAALCAAQSHLCNLEGRGYCTRYEKSKKLYRDVSDLIGRLASMPSPTGVFKF